VLFKYKQMSLVTDYPSGTLLEIAGAWLRQTFHGVLKKYSRFTPYFLA